MQSELHSKKSIRRDQLRAMPSFEVVGNTVKDPNDPGPKVEIKFDSKQVFVWVDGVLMFRAKNMSGVQLMGEF